MAEINNRFRVKKGLDVLGDASFTGNVDVTGVITVPTQVASENSTKVATTEFVRTAIANLVASSPATLDTLNELAQALGNDPNFATTMANQLALKAPLASPALTGTPTAPTAATADNSTLLATTQYVKNQAYATLASPNLSGVPTAPTPGLDTNTTQIATAAFVLAQAGSNAPIMNGVAAAGTSTRWSRQDHVHPIDTSRAPLDSPGLTGAPTATTPAFGDNTSRIATAQFVQSALSATGFGYDAATIPGGATASIDTATIPTGMYVVTSSNTGTKPATVEDAAGILMVGRGTGGTKVHQMYFDDINARVWSRAYASSAWTAWREVAYTDSPALTGVPTAPTAAPATNSTQVATTAYADAIAALKANINNPVFTGNVTVSGGLATDDFAFIPFPDNGNYITSTASVTGAVKIKLPVAYTSTQISFDLSINEGVTDSACKMRISGMNRVDSTWQFVTAVTNGGIASRIPNVRFGNDGTTCCIWVGELADTWATPQIQVSNVSLGNAGLSAAWLSNWTVSYVTTFDTVKTGPITPNKTASLNSPVFTGTPTVPTPSAADNSSAIPNTSWVNAAISASGSTSIITKNLTSTAVTLTAAEYSNSMIVFTGTLTGNTTVTVPNTAHAFIAANNTTGSYTLTIKSNGQTPSVQIVQNKANSLYCDTTGVYATSSTTGVQFAKQFSTAIDTTLDLSYLGAIIFVTASGKTITLPLANTFPAGAGVAIFNFSSGNINIASSGSDTFDAVASPIVVYPNDCYFLESTNGTSWHTVWYSNEKSPRFKTSVSAPVALFGGATDNGTDKLQVTGSSSIAGDLTITNTTNSTVGSFSSASYTGGLQIEAYNIGNTSKKNIAIAVAAASRVLVGTTTDNGVDKLQVNGTIKSTTGGFVFPDGTTQTTANGVTAPISTVVTPANGVTSIATSGYNVGFVQVFKNNSRLIPTIDFTASDGVNIVLTVAATGRDRYEYLTSVIYSPSVVFQPTSYTTSLSVAANTITTNYNVGCVWVFKNNMKLLPADFTAANGTSITLTIASDSANDVYEVVTFQPFAVNGMLPLAGGTMTGALNISGAAGSKRSVYLQTAGSNRWEINAGTIAESGSNAGSNLNINRYDDTGTLIDTPISVGRSSGLVTLSKGLVMPDGYTVAATTMGRNRIINGDFRVSARNNLVATAAVSGYGGPDRFYCANGTPGGQITQSTGTMTIAGRAVNALVQTVNTAITTLTGTNWVSGIEQAIEGYNCFDLLGQQATISFYFNSNVTGTYALALRDYTGNNSYLTTFNYTVANTPQKIIVTVPTIPTSLTTPFSSAGGMYLNIGSLNNGSYQGVTGSWVTGNYVTVSGVANWVSTASNFIAITELQLEAGSYATPFERRSIGHELALCQRYYQAQGGLFTAYGSAGAPVQWPWTNYTNMRATPTIVITGASYSNASGFSIQFPSTLYQQIQFTVTNTGTATANVGWTASAEL